MDRPLMGDRPLIGVTASSRGGHIGWWFNRLALYRAGARAVRITADDPYPIHGLDGLVVGGGDDIDATLYGVHLEPAVKVDPERDRLELGALDCAEEVVLPVLGICRGAQMVNIHRGGSLHTDIYEVYLHAPKMRTVLPRKRIAIEPGSRLHRILGLLECRVNALHHQSIDHLGEGLQVVARDDSGIVQAIEAPEHPFLLGVQWHPEFLVADRHQRRLFQELAAAATQRRQRRQSAALARTAS